MPQRRRKRLDSGQGAVKWAVQRGGTFDVDVVGNGQVHEVVSQQSIARLCLAVWQDIVHLELRRGVGAAAVGWGCAISPVVCHRLSSGDAIFMRKDEKLNTRYAFTMKVEAIKSSHLKNVQFIDDNDKLVSYFLTSVRMNSNNAWAKCVFN